MPSICVFCGSSDGLDGIYRESAVAVGRFLAERGITLVYGGASIGLMGAVADAALAAGGTVYGVIPQALMDREIAHGGLSRLFVVSDMHSRKIRMAELADGFIALPGGIGTLEELFEQWTWAQLGIHAKPIGLLNVGGYFDSLLDFLGRMKTDGFVSAAEHGRLIVDDDARRLIATVQAAISRRPA